MIRRTTLLLATTVVLLLSSVAYAVPDTTGARQDTIATQILEERVKQNAEKTQIQIECIQDEMRVRTDALEHRLDIYAGIAVLLMAFLSWFGYKTVKGWAKDRIVLMADKVFEKGLTDFKKRATEQVTGLIAEQTAKAEKQRREIDQRAQELFGKYSARAADREKPEDAVDTGELSEYMEKLAETKAKVQYTAKDWYLLGYEACHRSDWEAAVTCYTESIKLNPDLTESYNNRGFVLDELERFDEALIDYDRAIELNPKYARAYNNRGHTLGRLGRYDEALNTIDKALEIDPEQVKVLINSVEVRIVLGQYDGALQQASKALDLSESSEEKAMALYLKCIAEKLSGKDTSASEAELDRILEEEFEVTWSFDDIDGWLEKADISEEADEFIRAKSAMLKAKKKKR